MTEREKDERIAALEKQVADLTEALMKALMAPQFIPVPMPMPILPPCPQYPVLPGPTWQPPLFPSTTTCQC
jgi:hypothetical protein